MVLNNNEKDWLLKKKNDRYGGYGSFIGMVFNNSFQYDKPFDDVLKDAVVKSMEVDKVIEEHKIKNLPSFEGD